MVLTINPKYAKRRVSHHNTCKTIEDHDPDELLQLAIEARKANDTCLLECFDENLPSLADLQAQKTRVEIAMAKGVAPTLTEDWQIAASQPTVAAVLAAKKQLDEE